MWLILALQNGQTFAEHSNDLIPAFLFVMITLTGVIGAMIIAYIKQNRLDMSELKVGQGVFTKLLADHILEETNTFNKLDKRVTRIEDRIGIHTEIED